MSRSYVKRSPSEGLPGQHGSGSREFAMHAGGVCLGEELGEDGVDPIGGEQGGTVA